MCPNLVRIDLADNGLTDGAVEQLMPTLAACPLLRRIGLAENNICDDGIVKYLVPALSKGACQELDYIDLEWNEIGDIGAQACAQLF